MAADKKFDDEERPQPGSSTTDAPDGRLDADRADFHRRVTTKERRTRQARAEGDRSLRAGLGAFGMVGWSIVVPSLIGVAVGLWLDRRLGGGVRFTLSLLVGGLIVGMLNVWHWMNAR